MRLLKKGCIFGNERCHMYTVEWQKRGLPHVHIILWLKDKIRPESIDKVICAELPDSKLDPSLYEIIRTTMIHGPCGHINKNSPRMLNGNCTKKYPRCFQKETQTGEDGYSQYRRRSPDDGGIVTQIKGNNVDNRWVVPYNPVLSRTFNAHINVEFCNSVKSVKYTCKYVNKGTDQATFGVKDQDEVTRYESGRYISSSEAVWRILYFPINERFPPVMHLSVHLENGQRVYFTEDNVIHKIINPQKTTLMAFFELCQVDNFVKTLLYCEVPAYYIWKNSKFYRRKKRKGCFWLSGNQERPGFGKSIYCTSWQC
ncbi:ATP-dependent DNA helicase [Trichonephila clavipes]|uniref:ATP-dependent DNA helicase n=1 Tax=Trichonephila clavipes TaxID=2585209 RepID=A0A8X6RYT1_TRICX|nr:ATP-dependent DNA helicase [Trichonephila clavipes]